MTGPSRPSAVLFDLDGTLLDRRASIRAYSRQFCSDFSTELLSIETGHIADVLIRADGHGYRSKQRPETIVTELLTGVTAPAADAHWREHFPKLAVPARMADTVVKRLQTMGVPIGLITNGSVAAQTAKLAAVGWEDVFPSPIISEELGFKKPDRRIFELGLKHTNHPANETWFVGDHPVNDVWGAEQVGMRGILLPGGPPWPVGYTRCGAQADGLEFLLDHIEPEHDSSGSLRSGRDKS